MIGSDSPVPVVTRWDLRRLLSRYGPPAAAFAASWAVVAAVVVSNGFAFSAESFTKWDAALYQSIAQKGYEFFPCAGNSMWGGQTWCGNTGWLPLYAWLTRCLATVVRTTPLAAVLLTAMAYYAVLLIIWMRVLEEKWTVESATLLGLAAFFPGALYYIVPYPISVFLALTLFAFEALLVERYWIAGVLGGLATLTYSSGLVLVGVFGLYLLIANRKQAWRVQLMAIFWVCGLTALGVASISLIMQLAVGHWDAFFQVQAKYGYGIHDPLGTFLEKVVAMFRGEYRAREEFQGFQHLLVSGIVLYLLAKTTSDTVRPPSNREQLSLIYGVAFWVFPLVVGSGALLWRAESLLLPTLVLFKRLSRTTQVSLLVIFCLLSGELTLQYFKNWLP